MCISYYTSDVRASVIYRMTCPCTGQLIEIWYQGLYRTSRHNSVDQIIYTTASSGAVLLELTNNYLGTYMKIYRLG